MSWKKVKLNELCEINVGKTPLREKKEYFGIGAPWVSIADMNEKTFLNETKEQVTQEGIKSANMKLVPENTVLFSFKLSVGKVCITNIPLYTNEAIAALPILDKNKIGTKYLYYVMQSQDFSHLGERAAKGLTLNKEKLNRIQIPLPTLSTQQKIAAILDKANELRRKDKALFAQYDVLLQSIFYNLFGDPVKNEKGWEKKQLIDVCSKIGSGSTPRGGKESYKDTGISIIRSLNVHDNEFKYKDLAFIDDRQAYELRNVLVEKDDVLFNITGASVCRSCIVPFDVLPARVNQHVSILRSKKEMLNSLFLIATLISSSVKNKLLNISKSAGATREAITKEQLENMEIILPAISLQNQFAVIAQNIHQQKQQIKQQIQQSENLFQSLLQKAFNGGLVQ